MQKTTQPILFKLSVYKVEPITFGTDQDLFLFSLTS